MSEEKRYMLDTRTAHLIIKGEPRIRERLLRVPMVNICISAITEAELLCSAAKNPDEKRLSIVINEFLLRVEILPWCSMAAKAYIEIQSACRSDGKTLGSMDMLIAAHSMSEGSVLVTGDKAFYNFEHLLILEDWNRPLE